MKESGICLLNSPTMGFLCPPAAAEAELSVGESAAELSCCCESWSATAVAGDSLPLLEEVVVVVLAVGAAAVSGSFVSAGGAAAAAAGAVSTVVSAILCTYSDGQVCKVCAGREQEGRAVSQSISQQIVAICSGYCDSFPV